MRPGHAGKNFNGQLNSVLRVIHYGIHFADATQTLKYGCPPQAYSRSSPMSDKMNALLCNPYFTVEDPAACLC